MPKGTKFKSLNARWRLACRLGVFEALKNSEIAARCNIGFPYFESHWNDPIVRAERDRLTREVEQRALGAIVGEDPDDSQAIIARKQGVIVKTLIEQMEDVKAKAADRRAAALALAKMHQRQQVLVPAVSDVIALRLVRVVEKLTEDGTHSSRMIHDSTSAPMHDSTSAPFHETRTSP